MPDGETNLVLMYVVDRMSSMKLSSNSFGERIPVLTIISYLKVYG
jgi:hypothetical protein